MWQFFCDNFLLSILFTLVHEKICPNYMSQMRLLKKLARQSVYVGDTIVICDICSCARLVTENLYHHHSPCCLACRCMWKREFNRIFVVPCKREKKNVFIVNSHLKFVKGKVDRTVKWETLVSRARSRMDTGTRSRASVTWALTSVLVRCSCCLAFLSFMVPVVFLPGHLAVQFSFTFSGFVTVRYVSFE